MKKLVFLFTSLFVFVIALQNVNAQTEGTAKDVQATAKIITPITISLENDGLNFGTLVPSGTNGTVVLTPAGERSSEGNKVGFIDQESDFSAASFLVKGQENASFSLALPKETVQLKNGNNTMDVTSFQASIGEDGNTIASSGTDFTVGATLSVAGDQGAGTYSGQFDVTVAYE